jgi:branched-chain amino acid transport system ATP-binding protein
MKGATLLDVRGASKVFGGLRAVDDVSFVVAEGEIFGIAGPNGSGKSTLFNCITGIPYGPSTGEIRFRGDRIDGWASHRIARAGLARTFQVDAEFPDLSARETVRLAATYAGGLSGAGRAERVEATLERVHFQPARLDMPSSNLSVYEKKQLMIASALVADPKVLMLDEPASGLTRPEIAALDDLLREVNRDGVTILLIEHVLSLLLAVSQRLLVLNQGKVLAEGNPNAVIREPAVIEAYLGGRK